MSNTDFDPQQQPYFPPPPPSPLTQVARAAPPPQPVQQQPVPQQPLQQIPSWFRPTTTAALSVPARPEVQPEAQPEAQPLPPQRYTPQAPRGTDKWGTIPWQAKAHENYPAISNTSLMPTDDEALRILEVAGKRLSQFSAPSVAAPANMFSQLAALIGPTMDYFSHGAFSSSYRNRMLGGLAERRQALEERREQMEIYRDQMVDYAQQAMTAHKKMTADYGAIFLRHQLGDLTDEQAKQAIKALNSKYQHSALDNMVDNKGIGAVQRWLDWEDARFADILNSTTVLQQSKTRSGKTQAEDSELAKAVRADGGGGGISKSTGTRLEPLEGEQQQAPTTPSAQGSMDDDMMRKYEMSPTGMSIAHSLLNGETSEAEVQKELKGAAGMPIGAAHDMSTAIDRLAGQPAAPGDTAAEQQKLDAIKKIDFGRGSMLDSIVHYKQDPQQLPIKERAKLLALAHAIKRNYDPGKYKAVEQFSLPSSVENRTVSRASGMLQGYVSVLRALKPFDEGGKIPANVLQAWVAGHWSGDPKYYALESAIAQMGQETSAVTTGGVPRQGLTRMLLNEVSKTASPAQIRTALLTHMRNGWAFIDGYQRQYDNLTGGGDFVPGLGGRENWNLFSGILRMNPYTGEVPQDAPDELKDVGKRYDERAARTSGPYQDYRPPESADIPQIRAYIRNHQNDTDPKIRENVERFRTMIGGTLHLPRLLPEGKTPTDALE